MDRIRIASEEQYLETEARRFFWNPPKSGSTEAMEAFLSERKKVRYSSFLQVSAHLCFVTALPAGRYDSVLSHADKCGLTKDSRYPGAIEYEFWCNGQAPGEGEFCVYVIVGGDPPTILDVRVFVNRGY